MEVLFAFLNWAASFSHVDEESGSKMDIHNLATVMTPNILYPNTKTASMDESFLAIEAVASLIAYNDVMCEVRIMRLWLLAKLTSIGSRGSSIDSQRHQLLQGQRRHHNQGDSEAIW